MFGAVDIIVFWKQIAEHKFVEILSSLFPLASFNPCHDIIILITDCELASISLSCVMLLVDYRRTYHCHPYAFSPWRLIC
jgi:hypothetical protein